VETQTTATQATQDPMDRAMSAEYKPGPRTYFGQMGTDVWDCVLQRGDREHNIKGGKVPFDPGQHSIDDRRTSIDLILSPLPRAGAAQYQVTRSMIAESREWARIVKESLRALNLDLRGLRDKWVQVQLVPTGGTYVDKQSGETKDRTTFKFAAVYGSQDECQAAADAFYSQFRNGNGGDANGNGANGNGTATAATSTGTATVDLDRVGAAKFLPALWKAAGNNVKTFEQLILKTEPVNKYFDLSSPEVLALIAA
jgi:hypothetical protein